MFNNRFLLILGVFSLLLVTMAVSHPFSSVSVSPIEGANDFYQRHTNWDRNFEDSDYFERHPEWTVSVQNVAIRLTGMFETSDYFQRHPEFSLPAPVASAADLSDYFVRHPEVRTPDMTIDLSDYFLRH